MKMWTHFKETEKQLNQKKKKKNHHHQPTNENFSLFKANTSLPPGGGTLDGILSGSKCWFTMKPINQSQKHCIANATMSLFSARQVVFWDFTFVLNRKIASLISPIFPIYHHHLWGGRLCWSHSGRLTVGFYLGGGFCFVFVFVWGEGWASWIVCQSIRFFLLTMTCGFEKRKFLIFLHLSVSPACGYQGLPVGQRVGMVSFHPDPREMQERLQNI